mmetsp:Transcript_41379/g.86810  ORF Transcript_41379/g.86810 Transcript_41379/m.86810 type:complete len:151 (-) Transcript_41379:147-599(-)
MRPSLLLKTVISLIVSFAIGATSVPNEIAIDAASFVLDSLREINDSGIYAESLALHSVRDAKVIDGLYYKNTLLTIELSSEKFGSGFPIEVFEIIVMESEHEENIHKRVGYAIDRFPKMKDEEIESVLRRRVKSTVQKNKKIRKEILSWE